MSVYLSTPPPRFAPQLPDLRKIAPLATAFSANSAGFATSSAVVAALKSFAMLVGQGEGAPPANNRRNVRTSSRTSEARYAYYRRCQTFRRNGEQCKAPAMKGDHICHRHAEQLDTERRRAEQRREILSRPGAGLGSFRAIQRTLAELAGAILAGSIDRKAAGRLIVDIQAAIRLQKILTPEKRRRGDVRPKPVSSARSLNTGAESLIDQRGHTFAAINGRSSTGMICCFGRDGPSSTEEEVAEEQAA